MAQIPEYWIVNLSERWVEVYTEPRGSRLLRYAKRRDYSGRASVLLVLNGDEIAKLSVQKLFASLASQ